MHDGMHFQSLSLSPSLSLSIYLHSYLHTLLCTYVHPYITYIHNRMHRAVLPGRRMLIACERPYTLAACYCTSHRQGDRVPTVANQAWTSSKFLVFSKDEQTAKVLDLPHPQKHQLPGRVVVASCPVAFSSTAGASGHWGPFGPGRICPRLPEAAVLKTCGCAALSFI